MVYRREIRTPHHIHRLWIVSKVFADYCFSHFYTYYCDLCRQSAHINQRNKNDSENTAFLLVLQHLPDAVYYEPAVAVVAQNSASSIDRCYTANTMFRRNNRATTTHVQSALAHGCTRQSDNFSVRVLENPEEETGTSKFSVVVSKKVASTAVARNTIKRRVRAALQQTQATKTGTVYIVYAKKGAAGLAKTEIRDELTSLLG